MHAIDTNVVVRYLTGDHPEQSAKARDFIDRHRVFISKTVMLESEWVLRGVYGFAPSRIYRALRAFAGLPSVSLESPALLAKALDYAEQGLDFADALHLTSMGDCEAMITFDLKFIKMARKAGAENVCEPDNF
jgi:predicted nucleic-acid-binding protein